MFETNVLFTHQVLSQIDYGKCVIVGSSSEIGYKATAMSEKDRPDPRTFYAGTKAAATMLSLGYAREFDADICVIRPFSLYGPNDRPYRLISRIAECVRRCATLTLSGGVHDWIFIEDFIDSLIQIGSAPRARTQGDVIHVGTGMASTNIEVVLASKRLTGVDFPVILKPNCERFDPEQWVASTAYARDYYGIAALTSLDHGLRATFRAAGVDVT